MYNEKLAKLTEAVRYPQTEQPVIKFTMPEFIRQE